MASCLRLTLWVSQGYLPFLRLQVFGWKNLSQCSDSQKHFSLKGWIVNMLGFMGSVVSVTITRLFYCRVKAATDKMQMDVAVF